MISLIGVSGAIGVGKDLTGKIIQYLIFKDSLKDPKTIAAIEKQGIGDMYDYTKGSGWEVKKFAGKLKEIAGLLLGVPVEKFENQEFKKSFLGEEWETELKYATTRFLDKETEYYRDNGDEYPYQKMRVRDFLQKLGTNAIRDNLHHNTWVNATFVDYKRKYLGETEANTYGDHPAGSLYAQDYPNWIITDTRFLNEAQAIKNRRGIVIRIVRNAILTKEPKHSSETGLDGYDFDYILPNNGTIDDLIQETERMLKHFSILEPINTPC